MHETDPRRRAVGVRKDELSLQTQRLYAGDWARFAAFCTQAGAQALPAQSSTVAAFLHEPGRAARSRRLAAIDHRHRQLGLPAPGDAPEVRQALRAACKASPRRRAAPALPESTLRLLARRCPGDLAGRRDRAMLLLLAAGLGRFTLVALQAELIRFTETGLLVTDAPRVELSRTEPGVCAVRALEEWLRASGTTYGPVFRKITRWGTLETHALGVDAVRVILARRQAAP